MRILYIDIDTLRPDHLSCYGYHRRTSPNIDALAARGVRFDHVHATDVPCLPSRMALFTGRCGIHNGVINHGGVAADPFIQGPSRGFTSALGNSNWMTCLRKAGYHTAAVSSFGERHSAFHWYAGFKDILNCGGSGLERADEAAPLALDWLGRHARDDNWFLHFHVWDPHTPYRTPAAFGRPFAATPIPAWLTEEIRRRHWEGCGPHSAQEVSGFDSTPWPGRTACPDQPVAMSSMAEVRRMFDGYDTGIRYADHYVGVILQALEHAGVRDDTAIIVSSDHGECLGELNVYCDHMLADDITTRVPLIICWPGVTDQRGGTVDAALRYHLDMAATVVDLAGGQVPAHWQGQSFAQGLRGHAAGDGKIDAGRESLVVSQGAWSCQRAVKFCAEGKPWIAIRSYHDGYHILPDVMLFDLGNDPHEQHDLARQRPDLVARAMSTLEDWTAQMMRTATHGQDPMWTVLREGGPLHTRGQLPRYLARLRATGRGGLADQLAAAYPQEC